VSKAVAIASGDQLLGTELLQVLGINLGQVHVAGRVNGRHAVFGHLRALAQVVVELELGNAAGHREHLDASAQLLATGGGIHRRWGTDQRRATGNSLDRHQPRIAHAAHEGICFLGGVAGIQGDSRQTQLAATAVGPGFTHQLGESRPDLGACRVSHQHPVLDQPRCLAPPEGPDRDFDAVLLNVSAGGEQQAARGHGANAVILAPLQQALPIGRFAFLDPGLTQFGVLEGLDG